MSSKSVEVDPGPGAFASFEALRLQMRRFVAERAWEPFHTPTNVLLGEFWQREKILPYDIS
jgi:hypothetical protein